MESLSTASADSITAPKNTTRSPGEVALSKISIAWKRNGLTAARNAAYDIGELVAAGMLAHHKGDDSWKRRFTVQLVNGRFAS
jgi:hypothetical protein